MKSKKCFLVILCAVALFLVLSSCNLGLDNVTGVKIVSGGKTYFPCENWVRGSINDVSVSGFPIWPQLVADELTAIKIGKNFRIVIDKNRHYDTVQVDYYTLCK